jgi:NAD(P)-dependent dehydrogenase (short-subunit alcohol dehydrogenase family)
MAIVDRNSSGKVVLMTGDSHGIGAGMVRRFAEDGASVHSLIPSRPRKRPIL